MPIGVAIDGARGHSLLPVTARPEAWASLATTTISKRLDVAWAARLFRQRLSSAGRR